MSFSKVLDPNRDATYIDFLIKNDRLLPYNKGRLKRYIKTDVLDYYKSKEIKISINGDRVPYAVYLEEGTQPHDIPHAFGYGTLKPPKKNPYTKEFPFGVGGRFNGKFHPGSTEHVGFVEKVMLENCFRYIKTAYDVIDIQRWKWLW